MDGAVWGSWSLWAGGCSGGWSGAAPKFTLSVATHDSSVVRAFERLGRLGRDRSSASKRQCANPRALNSATSSPSTRKTGVREWFSISAAFLEGPSPTPGIIHACILGESSSLARAESFQISAKTSSPRRCLSQPAIRVGRSEERRKTYGRSVDDDGSCEPILCSGIASNPEGRSRTHLPPLLGQLTAGYSRSLRTISAESPRLRASIKVAGSSSLRPGGLACLA